MRHKAKRLTAFVLALVMALSTLVFMPVVALADYNDDIGVFDPWQPEFDFDDDYDFDDDFDFDFDFDNDYYGDLPEYGPIGIMPAIAGGIQAWTVTPNTVSYLGTPNIIVQNGQGAAGRQHLFPGHVYDLLLSIPGWTNQRALLEFVVDGPGGVGSPNSILTHASFGVMHQNPGAAGVFWGSTIGNPAVNAGTGTTQWWIPNTNQTGIGTPFQFMPMIEGTYTITVFSHIQTENWWMSGPTANIRNWTLSTSRNFIGTIVLEASYPVLTPVTNLIDHDVNPRNFTILHGHWRELRVEMRRFRQNNPLGVPITLVENLRDYEIFWTRTVATNPVNSLLNGYGATFISTNPGSHISMDGNIFPDNAELRSGMHNPPLAHSVNPAPHPERAGRIEEYVYVQAAGQGETTFTARVLRRQMFAFNANSGNVINTHAVIMNAVLPIQGDTFIFNNTDSHPYFGPLPGTATAIPATAPARARNVEFIARPHANNLTGSALRADSGGIFNDPTLPSNVRITADDPTIRLEAVLRPHTMWNPEANSGAGAHDERMSFVPGSIAFDTTPNSGLFLRWEADPPGIITGLPTTTTVLGHTGLTTQYWANVTGVASGEVTVRVTLVAPDFRCANACCVTTVNPFNITFPNEVGTGQGAGVELSYAEFTITVEPRELVPVGGTTFDVVAGVPQDLNVEIVMAALTGPSAPPGLPVNPPPGWTIRWWIESENALNSGGTPINMDTPVVLPSGHSTVTVHANNPGTTRVRARIFNADPLVYDYIGDYVEFTLHSFPSSIVYASNLIMGAPTRDLDVGSTTTLAVMPAPSNFLYQVPLPWRVEWEIVYGNISFDPSSSDVFQGGIGHTVTVQGDGDGVARVRATLYSRGLSIPSNVVNPQLDFVINVGAAEPVGLEAVNPNNRFVRYPAPTTLVVETINANVDLVTFPDSNDWNIRWEIFPVGAAYPAMFTGNVTVIYNPSRSINIYARQSGLFDVRATLLRNGSPVGSTTFYDVEAQPRGILPAPTTPPSATGRYYVAVGTPNVIPLSVRFDPHTTALITSGPAFTTFPDGWFIEWSSADTSIADVRPVSWPGLPAISPGPQDLNVLLLGVSEDVTQITATLRNGLGVAMGTPVTFVVVVGPHISDTPTDINGAPLLSRPVRVGNDETLTVIPYPLGTVIAGNYDILWEIVSGSGVAFNHTLAAYYEGGPSVQVEALGTGNVLIRATLRYNLVPVGTATPVYFYNLEAQPLGIFNPSSMPPASLGNGDTHTINLRLDPIGSPFTALPYMHEEWMVEWIALPAGIISVDPTGGLTTTLTGLSSTPDQNVTITANLRRHIGGPIINTLQFFVSTTPTGDPDGLSAVNPTGRTVRAGGINGNFERFEVDVLPANMPLPSDWRIVWSSSSTILEFVGGYTGEYVYLNAVAPGLATLTVTMYDETVDPAIPVATTFFTGVRALPGGITYVTAEEVFVQLNGNVDLVTALAPVGFSLATLASAPGWSVVWETADETIARFYPNAAANTGLSVDMRGQGLGTTIVTARLYDAGTNYVASQEFLVRVTAGSVPGSVPTGIDILEPVHNILVGDDVNLSDYINILPHPGAVLPSDWVLAFYIAPADRHIATVDANGVVTGHAAGHVYVAVQLWDINPGTNGGLFNHELVRVNVAPVVAPALEITFGAITGDLPFGQHLDVIIDGPIPPGAFIVVFRTSPGTHGPFTASNGHVAQLGINPMPICPRVSMMQVFIVNDWQAFMNGDDSDANVYARETWRRNP